MSALALPCGMILLAPVPLRQSPQLAPETVQPGKSVQSVQSTGRICGVSGYGVLFASAACRRRRSGHTQSTHLCAGQEGQEGQEAETDSFLHSTSRISKISNLSTVANFGCDDTGCTVDESINGATLPLKEDTRVTSDCKRGSVRACSRPFRAWN